MQGCGKIVNPSTPPPRRPQGFAYADAGYAIGMPALCKFDGEAHPLASEGKGRRRISAMQSSAKSRPICPGRANLRSISNACNGWCGREDSNFHGLSATTTSTLRVYQFRHDRTVPTGRSAPLAKRFRARNNLYRASRANLSRP